MFEEFEKLKTDIEIRTDRRFLVSDKKRSDRAFDKEINATLTGTITVSIGKAFREEDGKYVLPWTVTAMQQSGDSPLGTIKVRKNPKMPFYGTVRPQTTDRPFPAELEAAVYELVTIPGYGELHNVSPIIIGAEIGAIPPFGVTAAHRTNGIFVDASGNERAQLRGRSVTLVGPAKLVPKRATKR